ncbi:unnamed protein product, partial [Parnassius apollo]
MSFPRSRIINDRDIEEYLSALEGGYLSEDGMEMSDTEDNEESIFYTNRNEPLQDVEDDDNLENEPTLHEEQVDVHDPPLILETVASKAGENSACSTWVLDKRKLIWKKSTLQFSESNIEFEGSTDVGTNENKRGRPSSSSLEQELQAKKKRLQSKPIPPLDIRMDGLGHWPDDGVSLR